MHLLVKTQYDVVKKVGSWQDAYDLFKKNGEDYKLEILEKDIPKDATTRLILSSRICRHVSWPSCS